MNKNTNYSKRRSNKKGYKGKGSSKDSRNDKTDFSFNEKYEGKNDPAWYATDPQILKDAASIPLSWPIGTDVDLEVPITSANGTSKYVIPGVCTIQLNPSVGRALSAADPINIAAYSTYAYVRYANSGHVNYDAPDFALYLVAMSQVYSFINMAMRIYGTAMTYSQKNRYLPDTILEAQRANADNIRNNLANFRYGLNVLINKTASFAVPANMPFFERQAFLYQNIYCESDQIKDQMYMYVPEMFFQFEYNPDDGAGMLNEKVWSYDDFRTYDFDEILAFGNELLDPIIASESMNIMSGDILKAYKGNILSLASMSEDYTLLPIYNPVLLEQMKNTVAVGFAQHRYIKQSADHSYLIHNPNVSLNIDPAEEAHDKLLEQLRVLECNKFMMTAASEGTPEIIIENTRLTIGADAYELVDENNSQIDLYTGSEYASEVHIYGKNPVDLSSTRYTYTFVNVLRVNLVGELNAADINKIQSGLAVLQKFKFAPTMMMALLKETQTGVWEYINYDVFQDIDNFGILNTQDIAKMHEAAIMNELHVPSIAKV